MPGAGTCTIDCANGVFTYSGTSTTTPADPYIQPTPQLGFTLTGAASTVLDVNLAALKVLTSTTTGKIMNSTVDIANLDGLTGNIQTQITAKPNYPLTISGTGEDLFGAGPNNTPSFKRIFAKPGQGLSVNTYFNLSDPSSPQTGHIEIAYAGDQFLPNNLYVTGTVVTDYLRSNVEGVISADSNFTVANKTFSITNAGSGIFQRPVSFTGSWNVT